MTDCILWERGCSGHGYGEAYVDGEMVYAHRLAYEEAHGPIPEGHNVHHTCRVKRCINPDHLEVLDPSAHGALHSAERPRKLTPADVRQIRAARAWERQIDLAARYGVAQAHISAIQLGKCWAGIA